MKKKSVLSKHLAEIGRKGGRARMTTMTPEQRSESARKAAAASTATRQIKAFKRLRLLAKMTEEELGRLAGLGIDRYSAIEARQVAATPEEIGRIKEALHKPIDTELGKASAFELFLVEWENEKRKVIGQILRSENRRHVGVKHLTKEQVFDISDSIRKDVGGVGGGEWNMDMVNAICDAALAKLSALYLENLGGLDQAVLTIVQGVAREARPMFDYSPEQIAQYAAVTRDVIRKKTDWLWGKDAVKKLRDLLRTALVPTPEDWMKVVRKMGSSFGLDLAPDQVREIAAIIVQGKPLSAGAADAMAQKFREARDQRDGIIREVGASFELNFAPEDIQEIAEVDPDVRDALRQKFQEARDRATSGSTEKPADEQKQGT